ncbi:clathrin adaptor, mu subunit [Morchella conica CCBAS932]|uniref:Clathrin adaptor, mu subunit n=1 Tax=Morchella conica CCBAS932 TaxID=1392247 RepID=A0A3N4KS70_9PEZI|nr:clathrin adaptor, mu subunit [Morchella conica CCBAS932]
MSAIEALHIHRRLPPTPTTPPLLLHTWRRPSTPASTLLTHYQSHPAPRPPLIYLPNTTPPTLLFSIEHNNLLFLCPTTSEIEPLLVLEFLHRVVDVLEDFLGSPLLEGKIEANYDVVAQLLNEMCDDGIPFTTEPNALRDVVLPPSVLGKLLSNVTGLPSTSLTPTPPTTPSTIPWRRSNVRHTTNELYVDLIELITATIAPSGRPLSARSNGTIAMTCKLTGIPDLLLTLQTPSAPQRLGSSPACGLQFPVFHPCVRLTRWRDRPGELSFVPPDGKFVLASYEVDLLPNVILPVAVEIRILGAEFEVRVFVSTANITGGGGRSGGRSPAFGGSSSNPTVEEVSVKVPLPPAVKTLVGTRCSRGEFHHEGRELTWRIPMNGGFSSTGGTVTLRSGVVVKSTGEEDESDDEAVVAPDEGEYKEDLPRDTNGGGSRKKDKTESKKRSDKRMAMAMPRCALVSFSVKGWLASGVKVESLKIVGGKGINESTKPYKGVKYLTKAAGVEVRC